MTPSSWDPDPLMFPYAGARPAPAAGRGPVSSSTESDEDPIVRPFMLTGGRTQPLQDGLRIETLLRAAPAALSAPLRFESRRIVELCQQPMSVADLSVALRAPLGVVRVIVADLITQDYLRVEEQPNELSTALIERIRDRVRAL
jgi:hypothetical protein